jgi:hypothetical protein
MQPLYESMRRGYPSGVTVASASVHDANAEDHLQRMLQMGRIVYVVSKDTKERVFFAPPPDSRPRLSNNLVQLWSETPRPDVTWGRCRAVHVVDAPLCSLRDNDLAVERGGTVVRDGSRANKM